MACQADTVCAKFAACMTAGFCWASNLTDLTNLSPCLYNCAAAAGIMSQNDPAAILVTPLFMCAQDPGQCGDLCAPHADP